MKNKRVENDEDLKLMEQGIMKRKQIKHSLGGRLKQLGSTIANRTEKSGGKRTKIVNALFSHKKRKSSTVDNITSEHHKQLLKGDVGNASTSKNPYRSESYSVGAKTENTNLRTLDRSSWCASQKTVLRASGQGKCNTVRRNNKAGMSVKLGVVFLDGDDDEVTFDAGDGHMVDYSPSAYEEREPTKAEMLFYS